ncbi:MAG: flagellar hook assembly protein FlgD [Desulfofustis sp.]|nr:flagellar hook assembly protein FlgD [Desulfofustis sp.]
MSYIDVINQAATAQAQTDKKKNDPSRDIMGKEDFLTLLVAQLRNQDPMNPDEPTEFTAQLAQFSSLEQLFNLNESMNNVSMAVADSQKMSALGLIGKEAAYFSGTFAYEGTPMQIGYSLDGNATSVNLHLQQNGTTIATLEGTELTKGNHFLTWNGLDAEGQPAPIGDYTIVIEATAAAGTIAAAPLIRSEVTGVDLDAGNGGLLFTRAGQVSVNEIKGVYELSSGLTGEQETGAEEEPGEETIAETIVDIVEDTVSTDG